MTDKEKIEWAKRAFAEIAEKCEKVAALDVVGADEKRTWRAIAALALSDIAILEQPMTKFAEIQDAFNEIRDNQDQSRSGSLFRQWHGRCEEFAGWLLSRLIKERARAMEVEFYQDHHKDFAVCTFCDSSHFTDRKHDWTPADWEREAEKELREPKA